MQIGLVGVGRMGAGIAARLVEVGHQVTVWNRSADKLKPLADAGIKAATTPAELAGAAEVIISILTDAAAIDAVYGGPQGLLAGNIKGKLFIEMSTVRPETEIALAEKVRAKGAAFVECPVGGSTGPARQGKLLGLAGAEAGGFRARQADPRSAVPARRALRAGRHRRTDEIRHQSAADGLLAGAGRSAGAQPGRQIRSGADDGSALRYVGRAKRAEGARRAASPPS